MKVLVTGATGYVGGRLVPRLLAEGHEVRVLARDARRVQGRKWSDQVDIVQGDLLDPRSLPPAFEGIEAAYYLVHSMYAGRHYGELDLAAAENFVRAGSQLKRVIYLGALTPSSGAGSHHLDSRMETGRVLARRLPTLEFRAGPIVGSGSASFEMVRYLTERLPLLAMPIGARTPVTPISIRDVISYLMAALTSEAKGTVDIGANALPFVEMMTTYAEVRGLERKVWVTRLVPRRFAAQLVGLLTPITNNLAVPLVKGMAKPLHANTARAEDLFPDIQPITYRTAVEAALAKIARGKVETRWSDPLHQDAPYELTDWEGLIQETRSRRVNAPPAAVYAAISKLGGARGYGSLDWAWRLRGLLDQLAGGPGLRRGRRSAHELLPGEAIDFWRVERAEPPRRLRLRAEMRLPGRAWLEFTCIEEANGQTKLVMDALFAPHGIGGVAYWSAMYPFHLTMFDAMVDRLKADAEAAPAADPAPQGAQTAAAARP